MLGQAGALNYQINPQFIGGPPQGAPQGVAPVQAEVPAMEQDTLAVRESLTNDYYQNYNMLKSFVKGLSEQGIDPFDPYADPVVFQTMNKLQANVLHAANALKGEFEAEKQMRMPIATGKVGIRQGVDQQGLYAQDANSYFSKEASPLVQEANTRLNTPTYTTKDQNNFNAAYLQPNIDRIDAMVAQGTMSPEEGEYQKALIQQNVAQTSYQQLIPRGSRSTPKNYDAQLGLLKKFTNLSQGVWNDGTYKPEERNGQVFLVNEEGKGDLLGKHQSADGKTADKVVKNWLKDPDSGEVFVEFMDPNIPMERVSNQRGDAITRAFVSNNSKYGSVDKMMEAAEELGLTDDVGSAINEYLMPENASQIKQKVRDSAGIMKEGVKQVAARVRKELDGMKESGFFAGSQTIGYKLPDGRELIFKKNGSNNFSIVNPEEFEIAAGSTAKMSKDDVISTLSQLKFFNKTYVQGGRSKAAQSNDLKSKADAIKAKYGLR
jgi:hypothetical protein